MKVKVKKQRKKKIKGIEELKKWFSQESPEVSEISSNSDTSGIEDEDKYVNRKERNRNRKERNKENKRRIKSDTATKASHTVGLKPISSQDIEIQLKSTGDIKQAREKAVRNYLKNYLQFNDEELEAVTILDTKVSPKGDNTIYGVFKDLNTIKDIHWRAASIRNPTIGIRNYVPPQFWSRYMYLNTECSKFREDYPDTKTQLRFSCKDVEILMKKKGTEEPYCVVSYETVTDPRSVPNFDYNMKWQNRANMTPRRQLVPYREDNNRMDDHPSSLTRHRSTDSRSGKSESKKQKLNTISSSSSNEEDETI